MDVFPPMEGGIKKVTDHSKKTNSAPPPACLASRRKILSTIITYRTSTILYCSVFFGGIDDTPDVVFSHTTTSLLPAAGGLLREAFLPELAGKLNFSPGHKHTHTHTHTKKDFLFVGPKVLILSGGGGTDNIIQVDFLHKHAHTLEQIQYYFLSLTVPCVTLPKLSKKCEKAWHKQ